MGKKQLGLAALGAALSLMVGQASAGFVSGYDLLDTCKPQRVDPVYRLKVAECRGYVVGVADTFDCSNSVLGFNWDSSSHTSQADAVNIVIAWLRKHPDTLTHQASGLIAAALSDARSCPSADQAASRRSSPSNSQDSP